jgi:hypothetical protein
LVVIGLLSGCKEDLVRIPCDGSSPVWNGEVFEIVAATCLGSSCHGSGSSRGDFNSYAGIEPYLLDNSFEISVLANADDASEMPPCQIPHWQHPAMLAREWFP